MKKKIEKKLKLASHTIAKLGTVELAQANGGKWAEKSEYACTSGC